MRGVRDLLLVITVAAVGTALGAVDTEPFASQRLSHSAEPAIDADVMPVRDDLESIHRNPTAAQWGTTRNQSGLRADARPTPISTPWLKRSMAAASPEANDLRGFLANMAQADRDGHSIGITGEDLDVVWVDDAAK